MIYVSQGNLRMDFPTFSLPSHITCPKSTPDCRKFCYAAKAERMYANVRESRKNNLEETMKDTFEKDMIELILDSKAEFFRIHESGEFYNQNYLDKWLRICSFLEGTTFLVYTTRWDLDWSKRPDNLIVYWSVWGDSVDPPEYGLKAYVFDRKGRISVVLPPAGTHLCTKGHKDGVKKCNDCMVCYVGSSSVVFELH